MRRRGKIFKDFVEVKKDEKDVVAVMRAVNNNLKLVMELLADLRVNTSDDPKLKEEDSK